MAAGKQDSISGIVESTEIPARRLDVARRRSAAGASARRPASRSTTSQCCGSRQTRREIADVRSGPAPEIEDPQGPIGRQPGDDRLASAPPIAPRRRRARAAPARATGNQPRHVSTARAAAILSTASSHVGSRSRTRRAPSVSCSRMRASPAIVVSAAVSAPASPGGTSRPAGFSPLPPVPTSSGIAPVVGADDRKPVRERLGDRHAVGFVERGQHEHVGAVVADLQCAGVELAGERDAIVQAGCTHARPQPLDGRRIAVETAGTGQKPVAVGKRLQRANQNLVTLSAVIAATDSRCSGAPAEPRASGARSVPGSTSGDPVGRDAVR